MYKFHGDPTFRYRVISEKQCYAAMKYIVDAENFLLDIIDSITLNETSTNVSDHVAGYICPKETETL